MNKDQKLAELESKLTKYKADYAEKMKNFHGVRHENALSELRYTQVMVLRDIIRGLEKEIREVKAGRG